MKTFKRVWDRHKGKVAVVAILTTYGFAKLNRRNVRAHDEILKEHGLDHLYPKVFIVRTEADIPKLKGNS